LHLLSAGKAVDKVDDGVQKFSNKVDCGNSLSSELDGKILLNSGD